MAPKGLSFADLYRLAISAGFSAKEAQVMAAIGLAESGGRPNAHALTKKEDSRGLWQINTRAHPWADKDRLGDPAYNAWAARQVYVRAKGFRPWTVYKTGAYKKHLQGIPTLVAGATRAPQTPSYGRTEGPQPQPSDSGFGRTELAQFGRARSPNYVADDEMAWLGLSDVDISGLGMDMGAERAPLTVQLPSLQDVKAGIQQVADRHLGRQLSEEEIADDVQAFMGLLRSSQQQAYGMAETGGEIVEPPSLQTFEEQRLKEQSGAEKGAHDMARVFDMFLDIIGARR